MSTKLAKEIIEPTKLVKEIIDTANDIGDTKKKKEAEEAHESSLESILRLCLSLKYHTKVLLKDVTDVLQGDKYVCIVTVTQVLV